MSNRIQTLHPEPGKVGVNIEANKYEQMKDAIIAQLEQHNELGFSELMNILKKELAGKFDGSIGWYYTTVKLDLEARRMLVRVPKIKPQRIKLVHKA